MSLISILEAGRRDFLDATRDLSPHQAAERPRGGWSVLECIEHVAVAEQRYLDWLADGDTIAPSRDSEKEMRLFSIMRSRLTKVETPEPLRPAGRFASLDTALAEFNSVRDRSVQLVRDRGESIYSVSASHPYFGAINGAEWMQLADGHARRHADQIREIRESSLS